LVSLALLSFGTFTASGSVALLDALLKKVGSEYLFKQDPGPPVSNLNVKPKGFSI
jgi:hypothetical protein